MDNNKSLKRCLATSVVALALATFAELSAAASGTTDLATSPLPTAPTASVLPNIMFTLDDSGSMGWDYLPDYVFSHSGSPEFYSAQYNGVYYNPQVTYAPGVNSTGSVMTMYADGTVFSTGSPWTAVPVDAYNKRQGTIDLTFVGRRTNNTPFYYTITPIEYCDSITLVTCTAATAPTGRYIFPAPVRFCKNSSLASAAAPVSGSSGGTPNCQGKYISGSYDNERFGNFARTDIVPGTATYSSRPNRTDCAAAPNCTYAEEMTNYANWYAFYRTRMQMMKTAAGRAFATVNDKYRVGFITINPGSPVSSDNYLAINKFDTAQKSAWYSKLYSQTAGNGTPLREALSRVGRHFAGKQDGINRGMSGDPVQYSCQQNFTILTTDGYWNAGSGNGVKIDGSTSVGNQDNVDSGYSKRADGVFDGNVSGSDNSLADVALYYYQTDLRPSSGSCNTGASGADVCNDNVPTSSKDKATHQHMVTFTLGLVDGLMYYQKDYETATTGDFAKIKSGASGCLFSSSSTCDWPMPVGDTETALDDLWHAAVAGRGQYFNARDPNALIDGLNGALDAMKTVEAAGAASSTSTPNISSSDRYIFSSTYRTAEWDGEVTAQLIDPGTGNVVPGVIWSAQAQLDAKVQDSSDSRTIYTFDSTATDKLKPFQWSNLTSAEQAYFSNKCSGTGSLTQCGGMNGSQKSDANKGDNLLNYLRGQKQYQNVLYRDRVHAFGDTVNAQPSVVSAPRYRFADAVSPAYSAFKSSNASRAPALYIAANDGMLHALDATNGNERWSYVPRMLLPNLYKLAEDPYSVSHQYYVDGSPETMDVYIGGAWKTILVGGLNAGGRGYYALDVTDPASPKALWEFCSDSTLCASSDSDLGYTFGNPVIAKRKYDGKWVVLVTSGYNNVSPGNGHGYLYVLDAATGTVLNKVDTGVGTTGTPSGLSKISAWADDPFVDATIPRAYGADLQGNVWRFDFSASSATVMKIASLKDASGNAQPVTARPELAMFQGKAVVFVGTGRYLGVSDLSDMSQQSIYAFKDMQTDLGDIRSSGKLVQQTITAVDTANRTASKNAVTWSNNNVWGWYADFNPANASPGERVTLDPQLIKGTLLVVTNVPNASPCTAGGDSWVYQFDAATGGFVATAPKLTTSGVQRVGFKNPTNALTVGVVVFRLPSGAFKAVSTDAKAVKTTFGLDIAGGGLTTKRMSWRELTNEH